MPTLTAIDPGPSESAWVVIEPESCRPIAFGKDDNEDLLEAIRGGAFGRTMEASAIEMVASYGMPVGAEVFDTCVWIGRYQEAAYARTGVVPRLVYRNPVKIHFCGSGRAKDTNIIQALVDRFAPGQPNRGKGTKAKPGWFYGFASDVWQAYALAVYVADVDRRRG